MQIRYIRQSKHISNLLLNFVIVMLVLSICATAVNARELVINPEINYNAGVMDTQTLDRHADWTDARDTGDLVWDSYANVTLGWGEQFVIDDWALGNLTIKATDFMLNEQSTRTIGVFLSVYNGTALLAREPLRQGDSSIVSIPGKGDEIRIDAVTITGSGNFSKEITPKVNIEVWIRHKPDPVVHLEFVSPSSLNITDTVNSNRPIDMKLKLNFKEGSRIYNGVIMLDMSNFSSISTSHIPEGFSTEIVNNTLVLSTYKMEGNITLDITASTPYVPEDAKYPVYFSLSGNDRRGVHYKYIYVKLIKINSFIDVIRSFSHTITHSDTTGEFYVRNPLRVSLIIYNFATKPQTVRVENSIPEGILFRSDNNTRPEWNITIPAASSKTIEYYIKPMKVGTFKFPVNVKYNFNNKSYTRVFDYSLKIIGPYITLDKSIEIKGNNRILVKVKAINKGNRVTYLEINDTLPESAVLVNGSTMDKFFLKVGDSKTMSYEISFSKNVNHVRFPGAVAKYRDFKCYADRNCESNTVLSNGIEIGNKAKSNVSQNITGYNNSKNVSNNTNLTTTNAATKITSKAEFLRSILMHALSRIAGMFT